MFFLREQVIRRDIPACNIWGMESSSFQSVIVALSLLCCQRSNIPDVQKSIAHLSARKRLPALHLNGVADKNVNFSGLSVELFIYKYWLEKLAAEFLSLKGEWSCNGLNVMQLSPPPLRYTKKKKR